MHIPDGFVSEPLNIVTASLSSIAIVASLWGLKRQSLHQNGPKASLIASTAALIFAAQMLNFPIGGGTSGHLLGGVLAVALLGPWGGCLALSLVLAVQALFFADGGITALGSNILNMAVVGGLFCSPLMQALRRVLPAGRTGDYASVALTSWLSVVTASSLCAVELAMSGTTPLATTLPAMAGTHALIGLGEAALTLAALVILQGASLKKLERNHVALAFSMAVLLALFFSPLASSAPDGLEKVASDLGFLSAATDAVWAHSLLPDYQVTPLGASALSTGIAGLLGTLLVFGLGFGATRRVTAVRS